MKILKTDEKVIDCICGNCIHEPFDEKCVFNKIRDDRYPEVREHREILRVIKHVVAYNMKFADDENAKLKAKIENYRHAKINNIRTEKK